MIAPYDKHLTSQIDFNVRGLVGVRLLGATPKDAAAVRRQLGPVEAPLAGEPDIVIRFVEGLALLGPMRYLGVDDTGFTDDAFFVLRGKHKSRVLVQIPFDQIGRQCEIVCQSGLSAVPLLIAIVNLTVLAKGAIPLHASAFTYQGKGILTTGWAKGGKTETLLAFADQGAKYVGDEWIYLSGDGRQMHGIPEPIRIWDWHLDDLPTYRARVSAKDRLRMRALKLTVGTIGWAARRRGGTSGRALRKLSMLLEQQQYVHMPPQKLFGDDGTSLSASPEKIFFVASHASPEVTVRPMDPAEVARRMVFSLQEERMDLMSYYLKYRFAFPERSNELIETAEQVQRERLAEALAGKEAYAVDHPYPVCIPDLFKAIRPFV